MNFALESILKGWGEITGILPTRSNFGPLRAASGSASSVLQEGALPCRRFCQTIIAISSDVALLLVLWRNRAMQGISTFVLWFARIRQALRQPCWDVSESVTSGSRFWAPSRAADRSETHSTILWDIFFLFKPLGNPQEWNWFVPERFMKENCLECKVLTLWTYTTYTQSQPFAGTIDCAAICWIRSLIQLL